MTTTTVVIESAEAARVEVGDWQNGGVVCSVVEGDAVDDARDLLRALWYAKLRLEAAGIWDDALDRHVNGAIKGRPMPVT